MDPVGYVGWRCRDPPPRILRKLAENVRTEGDGHPSGSPQIRIWGRVPPPPSSDCRKGVPSNDEGGPLRQNVQDGFINIFFLLPCAENFQVK